MVSKFNSVLAHFVTFSYLSLLLSEKCLNPSLQWHKSATRCQQRSVHLSPVLAMSWTMDYLRKGYSANRLCRGWKFLWLLVHRDRETNKHVLHNACLCNSKVQARMSKYLVPVGAWYFELWHSTPPTGAVSTSSALTRHGILFHSHSSPKLISGVCPGLNGCRRFDA